MVYQIARGQRYGVISDGNKHHGLPQRNRDYPTKAVKWDNFKYHEAYTHLILQPPKENSDINDTRYKVSLPEDNVLFDIQQSV